MIKYKTILNSRDQVQKMKYTLLKLTITKVYFFFRNFILHNFSLPTGIGIAEISSARSF